MILMKTAGIKHTLKSDLFEESIYYKIDFRPFGLILEHNLLHNKQYKITVHMKQFSNHPDDFKR